MSRTTLILTLLVILGVLLVFWGQENQLPEDYVMPTVLAPEKTIEVDTGEENIEKEEVLTSYDGNIKAHGAEPFWSFNFSGTTFSWSNIGPEDIIEQVYADNREITKEKDTIILSSKEHGIEATIQRSFCSDGMSDIVYTHKVALIKSYKKWHGCALVD